MAGKTTSRRRLKVSSEKRGLDAAQIAVPLTEPSLAALAQQVAAAGGTPIGAYREPLGGACILVAALPPGALEPTPFQRDLSPTHAKRLAGKIEEAGAFLDPLIVVHGSKGTLWTPNGRHRLAAAKVLGLRQVTALVCPDEHLAFRILALNTEKAHNLRDRSLEVIRMARELAQRNPKARESDYAAEFEAPEFLTLGILYERDKRFSGSVYRSFLRKVDAFAAGALASTLRTRADQAERIAAIDTQVKRIVGELQKRGFKSPYLKTYVVARINPVRFIKPKRGQTGPLMPIGPALIRMTAAVKKFDPATVNPADLSLVAAVAGDEE